MARICHAGLCGLLLGAFLLSSYRPASAADVELHIRNHHFEPVRLAVPAGERMRIIVHNLDATPEEFESYELNREKVIPGNSAAYIYIGPLKPGTYPFFGEFHKETAQGRIVAE